MLAKGSSKTAVVPFLAGVLVRREAHQSKPHSLRSWLVVLEV